MTSFLIIDDEPIAHRIIESYCDNLPFLQKVGNCYNAFEAINILNEQQVDLIFLDINMPKLSGFDFLKMLPTPPKIIVTTAYKEFALEGYELNISDYLLKPFSLERFMKAIQKTVNTSTTPQLVPPVMASTPKKERFFVKGDKKMHQIDPDDILFIEAYGNYTKLYLIDEMIVCNEKISSFEQQLSQDDFLRVHKSFIVAISKIKSIEHNRIHIDSHQIPIGLTYKSNVTRLYNI